ncbi:MAG TPA: PepSY domain-containing protein [Bradyrhizobium sp.]|uniref:PepSY domain-containing protein n=1 Tax=Bradyrhizobium sp. TaxID=376 RepID=UPI002B487283|nr:PepSY domain-containing protein [Bradyrhizobium sp.]HKO69813.1 PepSY domain-containing protein [Bradyrhizobium sp.]
MRKYMMAIVAAAALGLTQSAMAYEADPISMQIALRVASDLGLSTVSYTELNGDQWEIQGKDTSGRFMTLYIDARSGEVRNLYR